MKIGIEYNSFKDISNILYILNSFNLTRYENKFTLSDNDKIFTFTNDLSHENYDLTIKAVSNLPEKEEIIYDYYILSNVEEPLQFDEKEKKFLENNIILSSTYINNFEHKNLYCSYLFSLYYFFYDKGFNFLNYYPSNEKDNLVGVYNKEIKKLGKPNQFGKQKYIDITYNIIGDDLYDYSIPNYKLKELIAFQSKDNKITLDKWKNNYISSYTDIIRSVCFLMVETWQETGYEGRDYITEKTLKSILFSKVNSFPILICSDKIKNEMVNDGFWFLNTEFDNLQQTLLFLNKIKPKTDDSNKDVYKKLLSLYGDKLNTNSEVFDKLIENHPKKDYILNLILKND